MGASGDMGVGVEAGKGVGKGAGWVPFRVPGVCLPCPSEPVASVCKEEVRSKVGVKPSMHAKIK